MYAVAVFALALLSPLPFISPFDYTVQDAMAQSQFNLPPTGSISNTLPSSFSKFGFTVNPSGAILNGEINGNGDSNASANTATAYI